MVVTDVDRCALVRSARGAVAQSFLTKEGGARYGAAVLTTNGNVFTSGQYSSWNHVTNIHAEQAALLLATMACEPDIEVLAVASTASEPVTRPCGVCRQVMLEHAMRISNDFEVLMAHRTDSGFDRCRMSDLLPDSWTPNSQDDKVRSSPIDNGLLRCGELFAGRELGSPLHLGDHVVLTDGCVAMVWEPMFELDRALVKLKYQGPSEGSRRKLSHSFTEAIKHDRELRELGWSRKTQIGASTAVVGVADIARHLPALDLASLDQPLPTGLMELLRRAGVEPSSVKVTGSRSIGLARKESDWDLVVSATPNQIAQLRLEIRLALQRNDLFTPKSSGSWQLLDRIFPGGIEAILARGRFLETILIGDQSVAFIFDSGFESPVVGRNARPKGHGVYYGTVVVAIQAPYKRSMFSLDVGDGELLHVTCFNKAGNLVQAGDHLAVRGWAYVENGESHLVQLFHPHDNIVWF